MIFSWFETDIGYVGLAENDGALTGLRFGPIPSARGGEPSALILEAHRELAAYLAGDLSNFSVPLAPAGTPFQRAVWNELRAIPYGETRSYLDVARAIGNPAATRAVGMANNRNPIPIFIPCHRVIGADGSLTGYAGGVELKRKLLAIERAFAGR